MSVTLEKTFDVFLSYSLTDAKTAGLVERALTEAGLTVFFERKEMAPVPLFLTTGSASRRAGRLPRRLRPSGGWSR